MRNCVKCFEAMKYLLTLLVCNSLYHTSRIIPLKFVTHFIVLSDSKICKELGLPVTVNFNITPHMVP